VNGNNDSIVAAEVRAEIIGGRGSIVVVVRGRALQFLLRKLLVLGRRTSAVVAKDAAGDRNKVGT
jgi:hypothetical protein